MVKAFQIGGQTHPKGRWEESRRAKPPLEPCVGERPPEASHKQEPADAHLGFPGSPKPALLGPDPWAEDGCVNMWGHRRSTGSPEP